MRWFGRADLIVRELVGIGGVGIEVDANRLRDGLGVFALEDAAWVERRNTLVLLIRERAARLQRLDHAEIDDLVERDRRVDAAELAVHVARIAPRALEVRGVGFIEEELHVLREIRRVRVPHHPLDVFGLHAERFGEPRARLIRRLLDEVHAFENGGDESFDDVGMVAHEVGAERVDVGDQFVGFLGARQDLGARDAIGNVVDVGRPRDARVDRLVGDECSGSFERGRGVLEIDVGRFEPGGEQQRSEVVLARTVLSERDGLAPELVR